MTSLPIFLLSLAVIAVWMLFRWLSRRGKREDGLPPAGLDEVNRWYSNAQDRVAMLEREDAKTREGEWDALPEDEQLTQSEQFISERFGAQTTRSLSRAEKLRIGRMHFIAG